MEFTYHHNWNTYFKQTNKGVVVGIGECCRKRGRERLRTRVVVGSGVGRRVGVGMGIGNVVGRGVRRGKGVVVGRGKRVVVGRGKYIIYSNC